MLRPVRSSLFWFSLSLCATISFAATPAPSVSDSPALHDARKILDKLAKQHLESPNVSLKFVSRAVGSDGEPLPDQKGSLLTADSGKFRLEFAQGIVVSDGKKLWQYFPANKQVIVKDASNAGPVGGMLLRFLQARPLKAEHENDGTLRVILDPASVGETLDSLILVLDSDKSTVREVETQDPTGSRVQYVVKALRYGVSINRKDFIFQPPAGVETVDMR